ncbi:MAG: endolytic transglycosylase MltG [Bacteroidota bacterium]|nr:endolytic transglycosylase MltG [Bacteroidota bacterium]
MSARNIVVIASGCAVLCVGFFLFALFGPHRSDPVRDIPIPRGASLIDIGRILEDSGAIHSALVFTVAAKLSGKGGHLQSGTYRFPARATTAEILDALATGRWIVDVWVTIPEGSTIRNIAVILRKHLGLDSAAFVRATQNPALLRRWEIPASSMEGYLFPDTYQIRLGTPADRIIARMYTRLINSIPPAFRERMVQQGVSLHETLTMASIIEGETRKPEERARVAGVYYNRLRKGIPLQADPTIQYIIPDGPRRLLYRDLRLKSPYNTYRRRGLPPGPINSPGLAAIEAALYPERHDYLYFVADGSGGHRFSRTSAEHETAVRAYRRFLEGKE